MNKNDILTIINMVGNSGSALNAYQLKALIPQRISNKEFSDILGKLESSGEIFRLNDLIFKEKNFLLQRNKEISRQIFKDNFRSLKIFSFLPWVRFISLTGSNAFESCHGKDDIDLFVITAARRLWIVYLMIVVLSKLLKKRPFFCFNYLIDEENIALTKKSYHNAVQIYMMKPLFNSNYKNTMYLKNQWVDDYLPNIEKKYDVEEFYRLRDDFKGRKSYFRLFDLLNTLIYKKYKARLSAKFPRSINKGILLGSGVAKLHLNDKSHIYDDMMQYKLKSGV
jgi:hypothetical protein